MNRTERLAAIAKTMQERILILDGSMGAYLQGFGLTEADYRKGRFEDHKDSLKGNNDLLHLTRPDVIARVHEDYLNAGVDIIETNTFSGTEISQAEYHLESVVRDINEQGARVAREACDKFEAKDGKPRIVAGALGPTTKLLSIVAERERSGVSRHRLQNHGEELQGSGAGPHRRRLRSAVDRNHHRHAEHQGRALGHLGSL